MARQNPNREEPNFWVNPEKLEHAHQLHRSRCHFVDKQYFATLTSRRGNTAINEAITLLGSMVDGCGHCREEHHIGDDVMYEVIRRLHLSYDGPNEI